MAPQIEILSRRLTLLLATSVGVLAANLYYAQPLAIPMATSLGLSVATAGLVVTLTQAGYGFGVLMLVPLADLLENRRIILTLITVAIAALLIVGLSTNIAIYFIAAFFLGVGVSCVQIIVPYATHLSRSEIRGQVVGSLMSGLMLGIMLSRPIAGFLTAFFNWHAVFYFSATLMALIELILWYRLPRREPAVQDLRYKDLLSSMGKLFFQYSVLRRRSIYQACMFSSFCLFWTAAPILLAGPEFNLSQSGIALFALVGVAGAVFAPYAGRLADRGLTSRATTFSFCAGSLSFLMSHFIARGSTLSLAVLTISAILLDAGVSGNLVLGQRAIFTLPSELRGRLNSLYIATIFIGGAAGSFIGAWAYSRGAWGLTSYIGFALPTAGLLYFATEFLRVRKNSPATT
jgi:predicted MFS family arabinose efflux permease